jgi:hypothetical protein
VVQRLAHLYFHCSPAASWTYRGPLSLCIASFSFQIVSNCRCCRAAAQPSQLSSTGWTPSATVFTIVQLQFLTIRGTITPSPLDSARHEHFVKALSIINYRSKLSLRLPRPSADRETQLRDRSNAPYFNQRSLLVGHRCHNLQHT